MNKSKRTFLKYLGITPIAVTAAAKTVSEPVKMVDTRSPGEQFYPKGSMAGIDGPEVSMLSDCPSEEFVGFSSIHTDGD